MRVASISVGSAHMLALATDGRVFSWGNGEYGRCGNGRASQPVPAVVDVLAESAGGGKCVAVAAGPTHSFALDAAGDVWAWGKNEAGQLGLGASLIADLNTMEEYPTRVLLEGADADAGFNHNVVDISTGSNSAVARARDGSVWQWGARTFLVPTRVPFALSAPPAADAPAAAPAGGAAAPAASAGGARPLVGAAVRAAHMSWIRAIRPPFSELIRPPPRRAPSRFPRATRCLLRLTRRARSSRGAGGRARRRSGILSACSVTRGFPRALTRVTSLFRPCRSARSTRLPSSGRRPRTRRASEQGMGCRGETHGNQK